MKADEEYSANCSTVESTTKPIKIITRLAVSYEKEKEITRERESEREISV